MFLKNFLFLLCLLFFTKSLVAENHYLLDYKVIEGKESIEGVSNILAQMKSLRQELKKKQSLEQLKVLNEKLDKLSKDLESQYEIIQGHSYLLSPMVAKLELVISEEQYQQAKDKNIFYKAREGKYAALHLQLNDKQSINAFYKDVALGQNLKNALSKEKDSQKKGYLQAKVQQYDQEMYEKYKTLRNYTYQLIPVKSQLFILISEQQLRVLGRVKKSMDKK